MEDQILIETPTYSLNKEWTILLATLLGGPLAGAYLMAENFRQLGDPQKAKWTWGISITVTIILFGGIMLIPGTEKMPNYIVPILYIAVTRQLVKKYQEPQMKLHTENGGPFYPAFRAVAVGIIGLIFMVALLLGVSYWISSPQ